MSAYQKAANGSAGDPIFIMEITLGNGKKKVRLFPTEVGLKMAIGNMRLGVHPWQPHSFEIFVCQDPPWEPLDIKDFQ